MNRQQKCMMAASILALVLAASASAQTRLRSATPTGPTSPSGLSDPAVVGSSIIVSVVDEAGMPLDKQAIVKLSDEATQSVTWGSTQGRTEAQFDNVKAGQYQIEVSAPGFKTAQQELTASSSHEAYRVLVALPLDVSGAVTDIKPGQVLAPKARKEVEKGMAALRQGDLAEAQKNLEEAYKLAPANADVNYLLGVLYVRRKDAARAQVYLNRAISLDSRHVGALFSNQLFRWIQNSGGAIGCSLTRTSNSKSSGTPGNRRRWRFRKAKAAQWKPDSCWARRSQGLDGRKKQYNRSSFSCARSQTARPRPAPES
jgi:tetratricopeptide (TPR) repeat protein